MLLRSTKIFKMRLPTGIHFAKVINSPSMIKYNKKVDFCLIFLFSKKKIMEFCTVMLQTTTLLFPQTIATTPLRIPRRRPFGV